MRRLDAETMGDGRGLRDMAPGARALPPSTGGLSGPADGPGRSRRGWRRSRIQPEFADGPRRLAMALEEPYSPPAPTGVFAFGQ